jgi:hypothetical protein
MSLCTLGRVLLSKAPVRGAAHGEHEKRTRQHDANWPDWYAAHMVAERSGEQLPS